MKTPSLITVSLLAALLPMAATAADTPEPAPAARAAPAPQPLAAAQAHIKAAQWGAAIDELKRVNATGSADWNNLMGYALRKQAKPDLGAAQKHYDMALKLNPRHQGALEYAGELALMKRDLATAEAHLASLSKLCSTPCEPLDDLKTAVAAYKAAKR